tara:strand:- start:80 stop:277 length:198 start_codon:yes stop_codon:yes gene_type:complete
MNKNTYDGLYEIADAIREHSKSIDNLAQIVRWSFMDDWDNNVPNKLEQLAVALRTLKDDIKNFER